jgi:hypothetical protein
VLNRGKKTKIPKNKKKLVQSLLDTSKSLFGHDYLKTEHTQLRRGGEKHSETCYTVNPEWLKRHMDLFRYSARSQEWKLDIEIAHRYDLIHAIDYSNPNTDATDEIHICEPMDCSKTLEDPELEQKRREEWVDLTQRPLERVCAPAKDEPVTQKPDPWSRPHRLSVVTPCDSSLTLQASGQKKPKCAQVNEEKEKERRKTLRAKYKCFFKTDF